MTSMRLLMMAIVCVSNSGLVWPVSGTKMDPTNCSDQFGGVCVRVQDPCPFKKTHKDFNTKQKRQHFCASNDYRCCVPPEPKVQFRRDDLCGYGLQKSAGVRIVGGKKVQQRESWPWHVNLVYGIREDKKARLPCGASLISSRWVLSAAHCLKDNSIRYPYVLVGHTNRNPEAGKLIKIRRIIPFPIYKLTDLGDPYDIMLIELQEAAILTDTVKTICLPNVNEDFSDMVCTVTGLGKLSEGNKNITKFMMAVDLPTVPLQECANYNGQRNASIYTDNICAGFVSGERDACQGDSGGPLVCKKEDQNGDERWVQPGIVSFGEGCARPRSPGAYTRVTQYLEWIESVTKLPFYDGSYVKNPLKKFRPQKVEKVVPK